MINALPVLLSLSFDAKRCVAAIAVIVSVLANYSNPMEFPEVDSGVTSLRGAEMAQPAPHAAHSSARTMTQHETTFKCCMDA